MQQPVVTCKQGFYKELENIGKTYKAYLKFRFPGKKK